MSTAVIPEPIAQLQRQLDQIRNTQPREKKLPDSVWQAAVEHRPGTRCVFRRAPVTAGLYRAEETAWRSFLELIAPSSAMLQSAMRPFTPRAPTAFCLRCRLDCYRVERTRSRAGVAPVQSSAFHGTLLRQLWVALVGTEPMDPAAYQCSGLNLTTSPSVGNSDSCMVLLPSGFHRPSTAKDEMAYGRPSQPNTEFASQI
jgi:hypothetical protein